MANYPLCKYANNRTTSIRVDVKCEVTGAPCAYIRWCNHQRTVKMNDMYKKFGCKTEQEKDIQEGQK